jgi:predicted nucleic acid-binding protein
VADYLLDSDVIIWILRGKPGAIDTIRDLQSRGTLGCSSLSPFEVESGIKPGEEDRTREFLRSLRCYVPDAEAAGRAAGWFREYRRKGRRLDFMDLLIGATRLGGTSRS